VRRYGTISDVAAAAEFPAEPEAAVARWWPAADPDARAVLAALLADGNPTGFEELAAAAALTRPAVRAALLAAGALVRIEGGRATFASEAVRSAVRSLVPLPDRPSARTFARAAYRDAAEQAGVDADRLARAALGFSGGHGVEVTMLDGTAIGFLRRALAMAPADAALRTEVLARLSVATGGLSAPDERLAQSTEAVGSARELGDDHALATALAAHCDAMAGPDYCAERRRLAGQIVAAGERLADPAIQVLGLRLRLVAAAELGETAEIDRCILAVEALTATARRPDLNWYSPLWRAMRAAAAGDVERAHSALDTAAALGEAAGSDNAAVLVTTARWCLACDTQDAAFLRTGLAILDTLPPAPWVGVARALSLAHLGRTAEASRELTAAGPSLLAAEQDSEWLPTLAQVTETVALLGGHPLAEPVYGLLLPYRALFAVEGLGAYLRGSIERYLALVAGPGAADAHRAAADAANVAAGLATLIGRAGPVGTGRPKAATAARFAPDGDGWLLEFAGRSARLHDRKGLHDLRILLERPGEPVPAVALFAGASGAPAQGHLGAVIDARAREAYRRRLAELEDRADAGDAAAGAERDALVAQLTAAYGLGRRERLAGDPAERARSAVTARIRDAIGRIETAHPDLGRHLRLAVHTGRVCVYEPETPHRWLTS